MKADQVYAILNNKIENVDKPTDEQVGAAVDAFLTENPITAGAIAQQAQQIQENMNNIQQVENDLSQTKVDLNHISDESFYAYKESAKAIYTETVGYRWGSAGTSQSVSEGNNAISITYPTNGKLYLSGSFSNYIFFVSNTDTITRIDLVGDYSTEEEYELAVPNNCKEIRINVRNNKVSAFKYPFSCRYVGAYRTAKKEVESMIGVLPSYYESYMESIKEKCNLLDATIGKDGDSFIFVADPHWENNFKQSPVLIKWLCENTNVGMVVCGGDICAEHDNINKAYESMSDYRAKMPKTMISVRGNHDEFPNSATPSKDQFTISKSSWYGLMERQFEKTKGITIDKEPYFIIDNEAQKIRYIVLDSGSASPNPYTSDSNKQITFMQNALTEKDSSWTVLIIVHIIFNGAKLVDGGLPTIASRTQSYLINKINEVYSQINAKFIGVLSGHTHRDYSIRESVNNYWLISTDTDSISTIYDPYIDERVQGTTKEQCFDIMRIDTANRKLYATRIGAGEDRVFEY